MTQGPFFQVVQPSVTFASKGMRRTPNILTSQTLQTFICKTSHHSNYDLLLLEEKGEKNKENTIPKNNTKVLSLARKIIGSYPIDNEDIGKHIDICEQRGSDS